MIEPGCAQDPLQAEPAGQPYWMHQSGTIWLPRLAAYAWFRASYIWCLLLAWLPAPACRVKAR